jgi:hypothetical protein
MSGDGTEKGRGSKSRRLNRGPPAQPRAEGAKQAQTHAESETAGERESE